MPRSGSRSKNTRSGVRQQPAATPTPSSSRDDTPFNILGAVNDGAAPAGDAEESNEEEEEEPEGGGEEGETCSPRPETQPPSQEFPGISSPARTPRARCLRITRCGSRLLLI